MTELKYRVASEDDVEKMLFGMEEFFYFSRLKEVGTFDKERVRKILTSLVKSPEFIALVCKKEEEIIGFITAFKSPNLFEEGTVCAEQVWWVSHDFRGTKVGLTLLKLMLQWAKEQNCSIVQMGSAEGYSNVTKIYEKMGFVHVESTFWGRLT